MKNNKIFIDGREGTTGLMIEERLKNFPNITLIEIEPELRKDKNERKRLLNQADVAILCLPDEAAKESVSLIEKGETRVIDASTAHRTADGWVYGMPELNKEQQGLIKEAKRVAVPGCHATGFIGVVYPLIKTGIISPDYNITATSVTGYSGGGKSMIATYEQNRQKCDERTSPAFYALGLTHKHIPEMQRICGLESRPVFTPIVADFYKGMTVAVPLFSKLFNKKFSVSELYDFYKDYYSGQSCIEIMTAEQSAPNGFLYAQECNDTNKLQMTVSGNGEELLVTARLDNLGKGSSGAAVQCLEIMIKQ